MMVPGIWLSEEMADTEDNELDIDDASEQGREKFGGKKALLFIVLPILLLGGGAGVYFSGILDDDKMIAAQADKPAAPPPPAESKYFDLPDMLVNLNSPASKPHFLKFRASLELTAGFDMTTIRPLLPRIIDKFQEYMRELRLDDLRANGQIHGLREELLARINDVIKPVKVKDVLFRNLLIQ